MNIYDKFLKLIYEAENFTPIPIPDPTAPTNPPIMIPMVHENKKNFLGFGNNKYENEGYIILKDDEGEFAEIQIKNIDPNATIGVMLFVGEIGQLIMEATKIIKYKDMINKDINIKYNNSGNWSKYSDIKSFYIKEKSIFRISGKSLFSDTNKFDKMDFDILFMNSGISDLSNNVKIIIKR